MWFVPVCDPEGKRRLEAFNCINLQATPAHIVEWIIMRWSVAVILEEVQT
jgi:hypothetical protein